MGNDKIPAPPSPATLPRRPLGRTGIELSVLGYGGFHLIEVPLPEVRHLLHAYLDAGGNYVETAASYGDGASEEKIGLAIANRRREYFLASKTGKRDAAGARADLKASLRRLRTDHLDVWFMHSVSTLADLETLLAPDGALAYAAAARAQGLVRYIGITAHGSPVALLEAIQRFPFAVLMTGFNYYDRFNFPATEGELLPRCRELGVGVLAMKPFADGMLHRSVPAAMRYTLSLPVAAVVAGINTREQLELDLRLAREHVPMSQGDEATLFRDAPELGRYVCRQCGECEPCPHGVPIQQVFVLEGHYDRQMRDGKIRDAAEFGMRERLRFWFGGQEAARQSYAELGQPARACTRCGRCEELCPYGIAVPNKLDLADFKLTRDRLSFGI